jgi:hypothetical protein
MTDAISEEMVEAGWAGMREALQGECLQELADMSCDNPATCQCRREVRAALAAALPLIVAAERARAAKIADDYEGWADGWGEHKNMVTAQVVSTEIAAAIRSGNGGE